MFKLSALSAILTVPACVVASTIYPALPGFSALPGHPGVIHSPLSVTIEVPAFEPPSHDPANGVRFRIAGGILGAQVYEAGGFLRDFDRIAIIGDTVALTLTRNFGTHVGLFLIRYNDGAICTAAAPCDLLSPALSPNIAFRQFGPYKPDPKDPTKDWGAGHVAFDLWEFDYLTVRVFSAAAGPSGSTVEHIPLQYRNVIPEPSTYLLTGFGLLVLIGRKTKHKLSLT